MGSFERAVVQHFINDPARAFTSSLFTYDGVPLPQTLCTTTHAEGVLSGLRCEPLAAFITVSAPLKYNSTRCNWEDQSIRPRFVGFEENAAACVASWEHPPLQLPHSVAGGCSAPQEAQRKGTNQWLLASLVGGAVGVLAGGAFSYHHQARRFLDRSLVSQTSHAIEAGAAS
uniref:Uncharacterized protein n=1 Tax=Haptolina brevifila TaxID=156173 RepID=A0A7S2G5F4_9EUKA|mmetsp:Transcript_28378/g.57210  ORF Transcript_28378/g.57210 Transcript_28378/m.57210 type:complete len:172 (+) Transcript_28378:48-563(+)